MKTKIANSSLDIRYIDTLSYGESALHRIDPRAKLITTLLFIVAVLSFNKYSVSALIPFIVYPVALASSSGLPMRYIIKRVIIVSPFALLVGIFNPLIDRGALFYIGSVGVSGGWVSFASIMLRFALTVSAALVLIMSTGFNAVSEALASFGVPRPFIVQLVFFYRYIFTLTEEGERMVRARSLRAFGSRLDIKTFASLAGNLLLRTLDRAERIYRAMCSRGFDGHIRYLREMTIGSREVIFVIGWTLIFTLFRFCNISLLVGNLVTGHLR